eukprot:scaffold266817_cov31-Tisochrysis_lutea.AAC.2
MFMLPTLRNPIGFLLLDPIPNNCQSIQKERATVRDEGDERSLGRLSLAEHFFKVTGPAIGLAVYSLVYTARSIRNFNYFFEFRVENGKNLWAWEWSRHMSALLDLL